MKSNLKIFLFYTSWQLTFLANAQDFIRCSTVESFNKNAILNPTLIVNKQNFEIEIQQWLKSNPTNRETSIQALKTIPVVVHVVYNTNSENISDAQILSQISVLNKDFRKLNTNMVPSSHPFFSLAGDANIEFCLASIDPNGNSTNGITRTNTTVAEFTDDDLVKFTSSGGINAWDATKYLNIWVCDLGRILLGYAQFPSSLSSKPTTDGVVIGYKYFGTNGTSQAPYGLGRTTTHEIGHWLGLGHIWADESGCSNDDDIIDTPIQDSETTGCPSVNNAIITDDCSSTSPGKMYQNYMDYTDDACMSIFSNGQIDKMNAVLNTTRASLFNNSLCSGTSSINNYQAQNIKLYPNILSNYLTIEGLPINVNNDYKITIYNIIGKLIYNTELKRNQNLVELQNLNTGSYLLTIQNDGFYFVQKIIVVR